MFVLFLVGFRSVEPICRWTEMLTCRSGLHHNNRSLQPILNCWSILHWEKVHKKSIVIMALCRTIQHTHLWYQKIHETQQRIACANAWNRSSCLWHGTKSSQSLAKPKFIDSLFIFHFSFFFFFFAWLWPFADSKSIKTTSANRLPLKSPLPIWMTTSIGNFWRICCKNAVAPKK